METKHAVIFANGELRYPQAARGIADKRGLPHRRGWRTDPPANAWLESRTF